MSAKHANFGQGCSSPLISCERVMPCCSTHSYTKQMQLALTQIWWNSNGTFIAKVVWVFSHLHATVYAVCYNRILAFTVVFDQKKNMLDVHPTHTPPHTPLHTPTHILWVIASYPNAHKTKIHPSFLDLSCKVLCGILVVQSELFNLTSILSKKCTLKTIKYKINEIYTCNRMIKCAIRFEFGCAYFSAQTLSKF